MSDAASPWRFFLAVVCVFAGMMLLTIDAGIVNVALPYISEALAIPAEQAVLLVVAYNLILAMTLLPFASLGDKFGLKNVYIAGLGLYLAGAAMSHWLQSIYGLVLVRAIQAIAASALLSVAIALVRNIYPPERLGRGMGVNTIASVTGAALAPVLGGLVIAALDWRWVFSTAVPLAVLALFTSPLLPGHLNTSAKPLNWLGSALCALGFGLLIVGLESFNHGVDWRLSSTVLISGVVAMAYLVIHEYRSSNPVLPIDLLLQARISLSVLAAFAAVLSSWFLMLAIPFWLMGNGFSALEVGSLLMPYVIATAICSPLSGFLSDKINPVVLSGAGMLVAVLGLASFVVLPDEFSHWDVIWRIALCGLGFGFFFSPNARLIISSVPVSRAASASSLVSTTRMFGQALGASLFGGFMALGFVGSSYTAGFATVIALLGVLACAGRFYQP